MAKANWFIVLALLFVSLVMAKFFVGGVRLPERRVAKWAAVESIEAAAHRYAQFFYPILQKQGAVIIHGDLPQTLEFFKAFQAQSQKDGAKALFFYKDSSPEVQPKDLLLNIELIDLSKAAKNAMDCKASEECLGPRAWKEFLKKDRDQSKIWLAMYRLNDSEIRLFLWAPSPH